MLNNNLTFCDYLNDRNFVKIEDKDQVFEITMKAYVDEKYSNFYGLDGRLVPSYKYIVAFAKAHLWSKKD